MSVRATLARIRDSSPEQREALACYIASAGLYTYGDRRFKKKPWTWDEPQVTYLCIFIVYATVRWIRKLTPIGE